MSIQVKEFGQTKEGQTVHSFSLYQNDGSFCTLLSYGGILQRLLMPDRHGILQDVVLGFDTIGEYENPHTGYQGALIGRYANRIAQATFTLDGVAYPLAKNDGPHHLHGGLRGFDKAVWLADPFVSADGPAVRFYYRSSDGEEGYPGNLDVQVTYTLTTDHALVLQYEALADRKTVINLTNHSYFNLSGQGSGSILRHEVKLEADRFTAIDADAIPTGDLPDVAGTALDFRDFHPVGERIDQDDPQIQAGKGYDHNFVVRGPADVLRPCAQVRDPKSGRTMDVSTTMPGVQLYTGNFLTSMAGKEGVHYDRRSGLCLETQYFPNSVNCPSFPSPVYQAGQPFRHTTVYRFGVMP